MLFSIFLNRKKQPHARSSIKIVFIAAIGLGLFLTNYSCKSKTDHAQDHRTSDHRTSQHQPLDQPLTKDPVARKDAPDTVAASDEDHAPDPKTTDPDMLDSDTSDSDPSDSITETGASERGDTTSVNPKEVLVRYIKLPKSDLVEATFIKDRLVAAQTKANEAAFEKQFVELAQKHSTVDSDHRGQLELFSEHETDDTFFAAANSIPINQLSNVIETARGNYIIWRIAREVYSTAHILISYRGAKLAPPAIRRKKTAAFKLAKHIAKTAQENPSQFSGIASKRSDSPSSHRGGIIAPIRPETLIDGFEPYLEATRLLAVGEISNVVETPYGYHIIKQLPPERVEVRHILISHRGSRGKNHSKRSKKEAGNLIRDLKRQLRNDEAVFDTLCKESSEDSSANNGGRLPTFFRGEMNPVFERYAFATPVGKLSQIFETDLGYHILKREQ